MTPLDYMQVSDRPSTHTARHPKSELYQGAGSLLHQPPVYERPWRHRQLGAVVARSQGPPQPWHERRLTERHLQGGGTGEIVVRMVGVHDSSRQAANWRIGSSRCPTPFIQHWRTSTHATDQLSWRCTVWTHLTQPEPYPLLPDINTTGYCLRQRRHDRILPSKTGCMQSNNFLTRLLYKNLYW